MLRISDVMVSSLLARLKVTNYNYDVIQLFGEGKNNYELCWLHLREEKVDLFAQSFGSYQKSRHFFDLPTLAVLS